MSYRQHDNRKPECRMRIIAVFMVFALLLFLLLSSYFIAYEADHDCSGENCPVCALLQISENNLRQLGGGAPVTASAFSLILLIMVMQIMIDSGIIISTPVSRKTRLNN